MKKSLIAWICGSVLLLAACNSEKTQTDIVKTVKADTVKMYGKRKSVTFPGKIVAASDINLAFRISGPMK